MQQNGEKQHCFLQTIDQWHHNSSASSYKYFKRCITPYEMSFISFIK